MNNQQRYLEERNDLFEKHKVIYLVSEERDEQKALVWAEHLASKFDESCYEAYVKAKSKLNNLPEKSYFLDQFPIGVKSKPESTEELVLEKGSNLESLYTEFLARIQKQAESFIDGIIGRAALKRPELVEIMFGIDLELMNPNTDSSNDSVSH